MGHIAKFPCRQGETAKFFRCPAPIREKSIACERILRNLGELAGSREVVLREGAGRETVVIIHRALFAVSFCYKHI